MPKRTTFLALPLLLAIATAASGVLIDAADGDRNVAPFVYTPELYNVGVRGGTSAIYLGDGAVITANHVGAGPVGLEGITYQAVPGSAVRLLNPDATPTDLLLFEVYPRPDLPPLQIAVESPPFGSQLLIAGNGYDRGAETSYDPNGGNPPGVTGGYRWDYQRHVRYGTNRLETYPPGGRTFNTQAFGSLFDGGKRRFEGQAVPGDSGGAAFWLNPAGEWELAGVIIAIVQYPGQPSGTTLYGQTTYYGDLSFYREQIEDEIALPEPIGALAPGAALVIALAARRRRRQLLRMRATASRSVDSLPIG